MKKWFVIISFSVLVIAAFVAYRAYNFIYTNNVNSHQSEFFLYVPSDANFDQLMDSIEARNILRNQSSFRQVSALMKFNTPKGGLYKIKTGSSNLDIIRKLRSSSEESISLTFNNVRNMEELCGIFGENLEGSRESFLEYFRDTSMLKTIGYTHEDLLCLFIPNTYKVYWDSSPENIRDRMLIENNRFWNEERLARLSAKDLTRKEAYILASIVQKESNLEKEKPIIAGVYLNRLRKSMLLQADPTVVYAVGDYEIRRVLHKHLQIDSPYNTYKYVGLPPGPIYMPDISTIDAVLNAPDHKYLYFCVKPGTGFEHAFAETLRQHNQNARAYRNWLNSERIFN